MTEIAIVGSANLDVVVPVERHPEVGETVLGGDHSLVPGGKGANQAVAAARLGASVALVGRTGVDDAGERLRASIGGAGVDMTHLAEDESAPSGLALITVGPDGDNTIVVSPGANARVCADDIAAAAELLASAPVLLMQLEVPAAAVTAAADAARGVVLLDPAPAPESIPDELLAGIDVLIPNESELASLAGVDQIPDRPDDIAACARRLSVETVVVTLGARGALVVDETGSSHVPAPPVTAVDTTGAGDAFRAALAVGFVRGLDLGAAVDRAVRVGAAATLRPGAQPSMPTERDVDELVKMP